MDIKQIKQPLNQFAQSISQKIKIDQIIIFGSYSQKTANTNSDVDIIVISNDFNKIREDKRLNLLDQASKTIKPEIQSWGFTNQELKDAPLLSTLGQARDFGTKFI